MVGLYENLSFYMLRLTGLNLKYTICPSLICVPGSLSPRGRSFNECVDEMEREEELKNVLNDDEAAAASASSSRITSQGSASGGWSSSEDEEDPMDQDDQGPPSKLKTKQIFSFFCLMLIYDLHILQTHRPQRWEEKCTFQRTQKSALR